MNENIIDFQKFKKRKEMEKSHQEAIKQLERRAEQKEKTMVSVKLNLGKVPEITFYSINDFLGENYIHCQAEKKDDSLQLSFPEISEADFHKMAGFLKEKNIDFKIEEHKER